ncbi:MAG: crossover junction endodeoxyribonuclease RuvC [Pseudomonadota bacterium]|jgi:crossover junction endodeoxyribonuclease RuvC
MTVILGIDPGSRCMGFGLLTLAAGRPRYLACGVVRPSAAALPERLGELFASIGELVALYGPTVAAVEEVFVARDPRAALRLGQARGAVIAALARAGIPVVEYSARTVKQTVVGTGAATKAQVQHMVVQLLRLPAAPSPDAADALGVAICHAHSGTGPLAAGVRRRRR